ncbi:MAG TPA: SUF system NifU family Fe-S cluster assembly protein [Acidimicrobiia bacterium]|nr:SUF system NifU family Fe-S cluster assembly protein [Acidimicrobiia bacterium]
MSLDELYREVILDHYRNPRRRGRLDDADTHADGHNPLCGDEVSVELSFDGDRIADIAVTGQGCSISQASASMMAEAIVGKALDEVAELTHRFKVMMDIEEGDAGLDASRPGEILGDLEALQGVRRFPVRIKCADLPWVTLTDAIAERGAT